MLSVVSYLLSHKNNKKTGGKKRGEKNASHAETQGVLSWKYQRAKNLEMLAMRDTLHGSCPNLDDSDRKVRSVSTPCGVSDSRARTKRYVPKQNVVWNELAFIIKKREGLPLKANRSSFKIEQVPL